MNTIYDNIKKFRTREGKTLLEVAECLGVTEATAQRYESGAIKTIKYENIQKLALFFHCSESELMGWTQQENFDILKYGLRPVVKRKIPHLGKIACGEPIFAVRENDEYSVLDTDIAIDFSLTAVGDSMIGANINNGDIIYIRKQSSVDNGEIAAIIIDDAVTLKRVYFESNKLVLQAENKAYSPKVFEGENLNSIRILGKAVLCQFKIK